MRCMDKEATAFLFQQLVRLQICDLLSIGLSVKADRKLVADSHPWILSLALVLTSG